MIRIIVGICLCNKSLLI
ncbi:hypothetical protein YPPY58_2711, partial [Yersinia pestis PY-58]